MQKGLFLAIFCMTYVHVDVIALSVDSCASSETNTHIVFHVGSQFFFSTGVHLDATAWRERLKTASGRLPYRSNQAQMKSC